MKTAKFGVDAHVEERMDGLLVLEPRDSYDQCIVGVVERFNDRFVLYSKSCVLKSIEDDILSDPRYGEDEDEPDAQMQALEHYEFNIRGGWVGETTPAFLEDDDG